MIIIAFVFLVIFFSKSSIFIFHVFKSQSIKIGFAFCFITASAFEIIVKLGIIISSFFFIFNDFIAISNAAVPLETAIEEPAKFVEQYLDKVDKVYIEGKLKTRNWEDDGVKKYRTEIIGNQIQNLGTKKSGDNPNEDIPF